MAKKLDPNNFLPKLKDGRARCDVPSCHSAHDALMEENKRLRDAIHAAISLTYIDAKQARSRLKETMGWPDEQKE